MTRPGRGLRARDASGMANPPPAAVSAAGGPLFRPGAVACGPRTAAPPRPSGAVARHLLPPFEEGLAPAPAGRAATAQGGLVYPAAPSARSAAFLARSSLGGMGGVCLQRPRGAEVR